MSLLDTTNSLLSGLGGMGDIFEGGVNYSNQMQMQKYLMEMQKEAWNREDTAAQRRVKDLEAAGLSPVLAAGSSASSSAPISISAPQLDLGSGDAARAAITAKQNISQSQKQVELIQKQIATEEARKESIVWDNAEKAWNLKKAKDLNIATQGLSNQWVTAHDALTGAIENTIEKGGAAFNAAADQLGGFLDKYNRAVGGNIIKMFTPKPKGEPGSRPRDVVPPAVVPNKPR